MLQIYIKDYTNYGMHGGVGPRAYFRPRMYDAMPCFIPKYHGDLKFEHIFWWSKFSFSCRDIEVVIAKMLNVGENPYS